MVTSVTADLKNTSDSELASQLLTTLFPVFIAKSVKEKLTAAEINSTRHERSFFPNTHCSALMIRCAEITGRFLTFCLFNQDHFSVIHACSLDLCSLSSKYRSKAFPRITINPTIAMLKRRDSVISVCLGLEAQDLITLIYQKYSPYRK